MEYLYSSESAIMPKKLPPGLHCDYDVIDTLKIWGQCVRTERRGGRPIGVKRVGVEVADEATQARVGTVVACRMGFSHVADQHVECIDRGNAVPLSHHPGAGHPVQRVHQEVPRVRGHHVE